MCTPSHPPRGSLRSSDPLREGQRASRFGSSRSRSAMSNCPTSASRSSNECSAAARRRSAPFRDGSLDRSDPKGSGAGVRKPTRPRTRTEPSARWVGHAPSGPCATVGRAVDPEDSAAPADKQRVWCASPGSRSAHRHPVSNARSSTVVSGSAGASRPRLPHLVRRTPGSGLPGHGVQAVRRGRPRRPGSRLSRTVRPARSAAASATQGRRFRLHAMNEALRLFKSIPQSIEEISPCIGS